LLTLAGLRLAGVCRLPVCLHARACADGGAGSPGGGGLRRPRCGWGPAGGPHACCCVILCYASRFFFPLAANMCRPTITTRPSRCCLDINHRHACHQDTALRLPPGPGAPASDAQDMCGLPRAYLSMCPSIVHVRSTTVFNVACMHTVSELLSLRVCVDDLVRPLLP
jgi:hypothetical protein